MRAVALALVVLSACMPASHRRAKALEGRYDVGDPGDGWAEVNAGGADHAWYNDAHAASLYSDSNCGPRFQGSRVEDLATELLAGLHNDSLLFEEKLTIDGRGGILRAHTGTLDGVAVSVAFAVVNKDVCTYDFALIAPPGEFDAAYTGFQHVLDGFATR